MTLSTQYLRKAEFRTDKGPLPEGFPFNRPAVNKSYTYTYNNIYELTGVSGSETSSFAYDKLGNRTTANGIPYTSNNLNQYTAVNSVTHTYDNNGNLTGDGTNTYGYDVESRLTSFSKSGTTAGYTYDAFNRRVSKTVNGTTIYYVYDADDIIEERSSAGALNADWVHGDGIDEPLTMMRGGSTYYYFADGLGSIRELTNSAGTVQETYTYNSYGQLSAAPTINNPFTFTGREYDPESGNFYYRERSYSPTLGRFLQRDPLGYFDSMNLQQYAFNSPNNYVDPYGLAVEGGTGVLPPFLGNGSGMQSRGMNLQLATPSNMSITLSMGGGSGVGPGGGTRMGSPWGSGPWNIGGGMGFYWPKIPCEEQLLKKWEDANDVNDGGGINRWNGGSQGGGGEGWKIKKVKKDGDVEIRVKGGREAAKDFFRKMALAAGRKLHSDSNGKGRGIRGKTKDGKTIIIRFKKDGGTRVQVGGDKYIFE